MVITIESWDWWKADGTVEARLDGAVLFTTADRERYTDEFGSEVVVAVGDRYQLDTDTGVGPMRAVEMTDALRDATEDALIDFLRYAT